MRECDTLTGGCSGVLLGFFWGAAGGQGQVARGRWPGRPPRVPRRNRKIPRRNAPRGRLERASRFSKEIGLNALAGLAKK